MTAAPFSQVAEQTAFGSIHRIYNGRAEGHPMAIPNEKQTQMHVRLALPNGASIDEDDIALIETIQRCRSILGASKLLSLSYRTTWLMSDALNRMFECKVIETFPGRHAATEVTVFGQRLVSLFRSIERRSAAAASGPISELTASLDWSYQEKQVASVSKIDICSSKSFSAR
jgi:molybdate transport system regulatory protein